jgi:DNA polymerase-4
LLEEAAPLIERRGIPLVGVAVANLADGTGLQLALPFDRCHSDALDAALDEVWQRFGSQALTRAVLLGRGRGVEMPLLPD